MSCFYGDSAAAQSCTHSFSSDETPYLRHKHQWYSTGIWWRWLWSAVCGIAHFIETLGSFFLTWSYSYRWIPKWPICATVLAPAHAHIISTNQNDDDHHLKCPVASWREPLCGKNRILGCKLENPTHSRFPHIYSSCCTSVLCTGEVKLCSSPRCREEGGL